MSVPVYLGSDGIARTITGDVETPGHFLLADDQELRVGTGTDLRIYHNGTDSYIDNVHATADLYIRSGATPSNAVKIDDAQNVTFYGDVSLDTDKTLTITDAAAGVSGVPSANLILQNTTDADDTDTERWSPAIQLKGEAWDTDGSTSDEHDMLIMLRTDSGTDTTARLQVRAQKNGGGYSEIFNLRGSDGFCQLHGSATIPLSSWLGFDGGFGHERIISSSDGRLDFYADNDLILRLDGTTTPSAMFYDDVSLDTDKLLSLVSTYSTGSGVANNALSLANNTAATASDPLQFSPSVMWRAAGWYTDNGTPTDFAISGSTVTMTDTGATFTSADVGRQVIISGATSAGNDGTFTVTGQTGTTLTYENASGVTESGAGTWTTGASETWDFTAYVTSSSGTSTLGRLNFVSRTNGGSWDTEMYLDANGLLYLDGDLNMAPGHNIFFDGGYGHEKIYQSADGVLDFCAGANRTFRLTVDGARIDDFIGVNVDPNERYGIRSINRTTNPTNSQYGVSGEVVGTATSASSQALVGLHSEVSVDSGNTANWTGLIVGVQTRLRTITGASGTLSAMAGIKIPDVENDASLAIANQYGILVNSQTQGTDGNYGVYIAEPSGGTTNNALHVAGGNVFLGGTLAVSGEVEFGTHINLGDSDEIKLGAGDDLRFLHNGTNNIIASYSTTADLLFQTGHATTPVTALTIDENQTSTFAGQVGSALETQTDVDTTVTVNLDDGNVHRLTVDGNITTLTLNNPEEGFEYYFLIEQAGTGSYTVSWPSSFKWENNSAPTLSTAVGAKDLIKAVYINSEFLVSYQLNHA